MTDTSVFMTQITFIKIELSYHQPIRETKN